MSAPLAVAAVNGVESSVDPLLVRPGRDDAPHSAQAWVLHLRAGRGELAGLLDRVTRFSALLDVAEVVGGDSWLEWGEAAYDEDDLALHVYFAAPTPGSAAARARAMVRVLQLGVEAAAVSCAGDWSEQVPLERSPAERSHLRMT